jgi:hypothetical protein
MSLANNLALLGLSIALMGCGSGETVNPVADSNIALDLMAKDANFGSVNADSIISVYKTTQIPGPSSAFVPPTSSVFIPPLSSVYIPPTSSSSIYVPPVSSVVTPPISSAVTPGGSTVSLTTPNQDVTLAGPGTYTVNVNINWGYQKSGSATIQIGNQGCALNNSSVVMDGATTPLTNQYSPTFNTPAGWTTGSGNSTTTGTATLTIAVTGTCTQLVLKAY